MTSEREPRWRTKWAISIYSGSSPLAIAPANGRKRPVLTAEDVTDIPAGSVADPFFLRHNDLWYLFFEVLNKQTDRGEIAFATSLDGLEWHYGAVALRETFHLSYPQVFSWQGQVYMIPETRQANEVRLYQAQEFPLLWRFVKPLLHGSFADATLLHYSDLWWLFAQRGLDELRLYMSQEGPAGPWQEHPASPLWPGNRRRTRPGGRILLYGDRLLRFAQDAWPSYGSRLRVFEIDRLNKEAYLEHELPESPILEAAREDWNAIGMHHIDAVQIEDGRWLAAVDGATVGLF